MSVIKETRLIQGLPRWPRDLETLFQGRGGGFNPWLGS